MKIFLNGEPRSVLEPTTISALVRELNLIPATLLIEHNGLALHREQWNSRALHEGDKIEFIRVVAGG
ncbi:MAG: thiamine biosynthesis protein ThiS [Verrucomicrobia bacterium]|nr:MAG: thiamine biosynthesis protein ThiS [Verrucomicrobiota bacterium]